MKKVIGSRHEKDGLYYLDIPKRAFTLVSTSPLQWHQHLSHPFLDKLRQILLSLSPVSVLECEACQFSKHHHSSFPRRVEIH